MVCKQRLEAAREWVETRAFILEGDYVEPYECLCFALLEYVVELEERLERDLYPYDRNHKEAE